MGLTKYYSMMTYSVLN